MERNDRAAGFAGGAVIALFVVGVAAFVVAIVSALFSRNLTGVGVCLIAAALSFGFIATALLRR